MILILSVWTIYFKDPPFVPSGTSPLGIFFQKNAFLRKSLFCIGNLVFNCLFAFLMLLNIALLYFFIFFFLPVIRGMSINWFLRPCWSGPFSSVRSLCSVTCRPKKVNRDLSNHGHMHLLSMFFIDYRQSLCLPT